MITVQFLAEWALRSSILIVCGALLLRAVAVKDPSIRLAAWIAMLCGSLTIPALTSALPPVPLPVLRAPSGLIEGPTPAHEAAPITVRELHAEPAGVRKVFPWSRIAAVLYVVVAAVLLLRLCAGLILSRRLLRRSRETGRAMEGIEIRESDGLASPVALGIIRSVIVLPGDWREWDDSKLTVVLAHERSHIRRRDPAVQLLSSIHRTLLWHSPMSWFLHQRIVRAAEEASDDAAVAATGDRASYAEVLLDFMRRRISSANLQGVAMARYCGADARIGRILDGTALSRGVTRASLLTILAVGSPLAYVVGAPQQPVAAVSPNTVQGLSASIPIEDVATPVSAVQAEATEPAAPAQATSKQVVRTIRRYMIVSDNSISGSWDSSDEADVKELREKFGQHFAWFWQGRNEYVVTDAGVLAELQEAMAPQEEVNRMQNEVNKQQSVVNQHQATVNQAQNSVNAIQDAVNRRQHLIDELQSAKGNDDLIRKLEAALAQLRASKGEVNDQDAANREQAKVNEMQVRVNEEQGKVNEQQHKVNEEQQRVSAKYEGRIEQILDSAERRHLAQPMK